MANKPLFLIRVMCLVNPIPDTTILAKKVIARGAVELLLVQLWVIEVAHAAHAGEGGVMYPKTPKFY